MIQLKGLTNTNYQAIYLNIYDEMIVNGSETTMPPLLSFTSQLTGNTKSCTPVAYSFSNKERYVFMTVRVLEAENLPIGDMKLGTTDFPYGLYDMNIYQNDPSTPSNLDPDNAIKLLYTGLMNLTAEEGNEAIDYTEYATNDSDTESVYITF
jgi:hypothetical protein